MPRCRIAALAAPVLLAVAACSEPSKVSVEPLTDSVETPATVEPSPSDTTAASESAPDEPVPVVGECRGPASVSVIEPPTDTRPPVSCEGEHGMETFFVGEMPAQIQRWPGSTPGRGPALTVVVATCDDARDTYLARPADPPVVVPDRVGGYSYYFPTEADWDAGARWYRCDAFVRPLTDTETTTIDGTLEDVYASPLAAGHRICETTTLVGCDQPHEAEWVATVDLRDLTTFPGEGNQAVLERCAAPVQTVLGTTAPRADLTVDYRVPSAAVWRTEALQRQAVCVVTSTDGQTLTTTVAGIGDTGALPVEDPTSEGA